ncbi:MAG: hypothetical protein J7501_07340 [Bdellovibrio sp.]|nr:hypothetical protein [Bdellovibrio sp.]
MFMDNKFNSSSPVSGNFSDRDPVVERGVQYNQGDIEDHQTKEDLARPWDKKDGEFSEVIDSEGHRVRINHY